jgi:heavy metal sensor kinase
MLAEIDQDLAGRADRFEAYFRSESSGEADAHVRDELQEFCQALPPGSSMELSGSNGFDFRFVAGTAENVSNVRTLRRQFISNGNAFSLEVAAPLGDLKHTLDLVRILLWSLLPVVIAIACVGGAWLSGRALKPVHEISAAALTISIENLSKRLPVPATGDELARLTEVLNTMFARLESAVKTLSQFVADASHELRTPLAIIRTTAELALRRDRTADSYRNSLLEVVSEAERMTRLVEDLLIMARSDTAALEMPLAPLDLRDVLCEVCSVTRSLADARGIGVKTWMGDQPAIIAGNSAALHRLFLALMDNAIKYSRAGGDVILTVERSDSQVAVLVKDFGKGIAMSDLPHIFKRFYRPDRARSGEGHGLGLSLAESIARAHGASIGVESTEEVATVFRVLFPVRDLKPELTGNELNAETL